MENYTHLTFIRWEELGQKVVESGRNYTKKCVRLLSEQLGRSIKYDEIKGLPRALRLFVDGEWDGDDFLLIEPGKRLQFDALGSRLYVE